MWDNLIDVERHYQFDIEVDKRISFKKQLNIIREDKPSSNGEVDESTSPVVSGMLHFVSSCVMLCYSVCYTLCYSVCKTVCILHFVLMYVPMCYGVLYFVSQYVLQCPSQLVTISLQDSHGICRHCFWRGAV